MNTLERRLRKAEGVIKPTPVMNHAEIDQRLDDLFRKLGTSRTDVIAMYGSLQSFAKALREK